MIDNSLLFKLIKFCCVGFSGMIVDFGSTSLLKEKLKINKYIANSVGFIQAATSNYYINRFWTFHSQNSHVMNEYLSFISIALVGLIINNFIIYGLNDRLKLNFYVSKFLAVLVVTIWNFGLNYLITFSS
jgi:putative flippase GtrA